MENFSGSFASEFFNILAAIVGINVTEMTTDINTDTEIAIPISLNNCPIGKSKSKIGINTTTVVSADPSIGAQTWRDPLYAAKIGAIPDCFNLNIFSWLTIDASTTIPTAKANPANEMTFTDKPNQEITTNVPITRLEWLT